MEPEHQVSHEIHSFEPEHQVSEIGGGARSKSVPACVEKRVVTSDAYFEGGLPSGDF